MSGNRDSSRAAARCRRCGAAPVDRTRSTPALIEALLALGGESTRENCADCAGGVEFMAWALLAGGALLALLLAMSALAR
ncbi:MAG TPA: hypothetical protein VGC55_10240 [Dokdonella sp.]